MILAHWTPLARHIGPFWSYVPRAPTFERGTRVGEGERIVLPVAGLAGPKRDRELWICPCLRQKWHKPYTVKYNDSCIDDSVYIAVADT